MADAPLDSKKQINRCLHCTLPDCDGVCTARKQKTNLGRGNRIPILQTTLSGEPCALFPSVYAAARTLRIHARYLYECVNGSRKTYGGYSYRPATADELRRFRKD